MSRLSASEAAQVLGVSIATLYAYVSRGLLQSRPDGGTSKRRWYDADEVRLLARRRADAKRSGKVAERSLAWGVPVLESRITQIANGTLRYRGHDAIALATSATLEEAAALLWECPRECFARGQTQNRHDAARWLAWTRHWHGQTPLERALVLLPAAATLTPRVWAQGRDAQLDTAVSLMRATAAALAATAPSAEPIHRQLATAWGVRDKRTADLLRVALVLCADHELNPSTFAVRCIASTGAHLYAAIAGGLAALSGPRHGGETVRAAALIDEAARAGDLDRFLAVRLSSDERTERTERVAGERTRLPGFGHPLYPEGDPRAALMMDALRAKAGSRAAFAAADALADAAEAATGTKPTIDFALAVLERTLELPAGAAFALFAAGRVAGWIAHAIEQQESGQLIRPRARYIGTGNAV